MSDDEPGDDERGDRDGSGNEEPSYDDVPGNDDRTDEPLGDLASSIGEPGSEAEGPAEEAVGVSGEPTQGNSGLEDGNEAAPRSGPLGDLAASVDERRGREADVGEGVFTEEEVPEIDADVVWEQLDDDEGSVGPPVGESEVRVVEKDTYCESCPYFAEPPEVACTHEGTEIVELVDMERFRVVDCPKVREDEQLEEL